MRLLCLSVAFLQLAFLCPEPTLAADKPPAASDVVHGGGLVCFTITPAEDYQKAPTCNALCEARAAVCTGVTSSINPPQSCESGAAKNWLTCRCCAVER